MVVLDFLPMDALFVSALTFSESFSKEHFLENCLIFQCLVTTLKMSLRMFFGVWYAISFKNISCII